jgi:hypothetical protein
LKKKKSVEKLVDEKSEEGVRMSHNRLMGPNAPSFVQERIVILMKYPLG